MSRLAQCVIFDEDHSRETVALAGEVREGDVPDAERNQPVGEARRALEPHRLARRERAGELRRAGGQAGAARAPDRESTRLNSSHLVISYAVFCLKKKKNKQPMSRSRV